MLDKIKTYLSDTYNIEPEQVELTTAFTELGLSSFEFVEMCAELEDELDIEINDEEMTKLFSVGDLVLYLEGRSKT